jgi:hypothetical protein
MYSYNTVSGEASHSNRSCYASSGGNSLFPVGGAKPPKFPTKLSNFRQPPTPFALEKAVFSPLLGQKFRKFLIFRHVCRLLMICIIQIDAGLLAWHDQFGHGS